MQWVQPSSITRVLRSSADTELYSKPIEQCIGWCCRCRGARAFATAPEAGMHGNMWGLVHSDDMLVLVQDDTWRQFGGTRPFCGFQWGCRGSTAMGSSMASHNIWLAQIGVIGRDKRKVPATRESRCPYERNAAAHLDLLPRLPT